MVNNQYATLSCHGRYSKFKYNSMIITFMHGKDLERYLDVKEWDAGYLVVDCLGKVKGRYEDYIDLAYILENLYMEPKKYLQNIRGVRLENV